MTTLPEQDFARPRVRSARSACAALGAMLLGCAAVSAQPTPPAPAAGPTFHQRVEDLARTLHDSPRLKHLSEQERLNRVEFVVGNTLFSLLHEMGHVIIAEMKIPVLGREEDAADSYAALRMLKIGTGFSEHVLAEASKNWFLNARRDKEIGAKPIYYGEHSLSEQRAYQIVCLMVGSDPVRFKQLASGIKMPQERQETCQKDYARASQSWGALLEPHLRAPDGPRTDIKVVYSDAPPPLAGFARSFRAIRMLEAVANRSSAEFAWPRPFTLEMRSCGVPEAAWSDENRNLRVCYELAFDFAELYRAYTPAAAPVAQKQKRKSR